jgi:hypothetical protein
LPSDYEFFLSHVATCANAGQNAWFLTEADFNGINVGEDTFHWNEWERITLEALQDDADTCARTSQFWSEHLPIMSSVHSDYAYIAIRIADGSIMYGYAPDFEEPSRVASSFAEFLATLGDMLAGRIPHTTVGGAIRREFTDFL